MASGGTGSGPARPKNQWQDAPAWSMGARSEFTIVARKYIHIRACVGYQIGSVTRPSPPPPHSFFTHVAEAPSYPGPGAYNLTPDPQVRRPQQKKGFARDQKNTFGASSVVWVDLDLYGRMNRCGRLWCIFCDLWLYKLYQFKLIWHRSSSLTRPFLFPFNSGLLPQPQGRFAHARPWRLRDPRRFRSQEAPGPVPHSPLRGPAALHTGQHRARAYQYAVQPQAAGRHVHG